MIYMISYYYTCSPKSSYPGAISILTLNMFASLSSRANGGVCERPDAPCPLCIPRPPVLLVHTSSCACACAESSRIMRARDRCRSSAVRRSAGRASQTPGRESEMRSDAPYEAI